MLHKLSRLILGNYVDKIHYEYAHSNPDQTDLKSDS